MKPTRCSADVHVFGTDPESGGLSGRCACGETSHLMREAGPNVLLATEGFHRIGRLCDAGRRSLWLREEPDAIELRAGREGDDARVRITSRHPLYQFMVDVFCAARFAAEWECGEGRGLEASFALDCHQASVHYKSA